MVVLDVVDAFWTLGLRRSERKFFVGKLGSRYYVYRRLAQGSRGAPLAWGRLIALIARLVQALVKAEEALHEVYVDDPAYAIAKANWVHTFAIIVLAMRALNLKLAFRKGQAGRQVDWIGSRLTIDATGVKAELKQEARDELILLITGALKLNVVPTKVLKTIAGKLSNGARLLTLWRPFIAEIWTAISAGASGAPPGTVWIQQVAPAFHWFLAFLHDHHSGLSRRFSFESFQQPASRVRITTDASPWGMGATLELDGVIVRYFTCEITDADCELFNLDRGDSAGQQALESLCALVALRAWCKYWNRARSVLEVRGDNVAMLTLMAKLKSRVHSRPMVIISREVALEFAAASYRPIIATHIPGLANTIADVLSRKYQPDSSTYWALPSILHSVEQTQICRRTRAFYRALGPP